MYMIPGRGMWKQKPLDWDPNVPYCDPNNSEKSQVKKKKPPGKILNQMMAYLVDKVEVILCAITMISLR